MIRLGSALLVLTGSVEKISFDTPIPTDDTWHRKTPAAEDLARYEEAATWSEERDGLPLLVIEGDSMVFEHYAEGWDDSTPHHPWSGTRSFSCAMELAAVEDGLLALVEILPGP